MADEKMLLVGGSAGAIGAFITAISNAFGVNRRLTKAEAEIDALKISKDEYITKSTCQDKIDATEKVVTLQLNQHTKDIAELKEAQKEGFELVVGKLDNIIENWRTAK